MWLASELVASLEPECLDSKSNAVSSWPLPAKCSGSCQLFLCVSQLVSDQAVCLQVSLFPLSNLTSLVPSVPSLLSKNDLLMTGCY